MSGAYGPRISGHDTPFRFTAGEGWLQRPLPPAFGAGGLPVGLGPFGRLQRSLASRRVGSELPRGGERFQRLVLSTTNGAPARAWFLARGPRARRGPHHRGRRLDEPEDVSSRGPQTWPSCPRMFPGRMGNLTAPLAMRATVESISSVRKAIPVSPGSRGAKPSHRCRTKRSPGGATRIACPAPRRYTLRSRDSSSTTWRMPSRSRRPRRHLR